MDALLVIGSTMLAAVVVFFIWVLLSDTRALKRTSATRTNEMATGSTAEQPGGSRQTMDLPTAFMIVCVRFIGKPRRNRLARRHAG